MLSIILYYLLKGNQSLTNMFNIQSKSQLIESYSQGVRNFQNSILTAIDLTASNLAEINFDSSNLIEINWSNCNLNQASFSKTYLCLSDFQNCSLIQANLQGANLEQANLQGANLERANLEQTNLKGANFRGANLRGANLKDIQLDGTCLAGAIYNCETIFDENVDPEACKMIGDNKFNSNLSSSKQNKGTVKKILSWCRAPKLNLQPQD